MKKFYFNLVEIALSLAIIAIGVSSIMVLFPVGLTASGAAAANNNIPDVAEYTFSYIRAASMSTWQTESGAAETDETKYYVGNLPENANLVKVDESAADHFSWSQIAGCPDDFKQLFYDSSKKVFKYQQTGANDVVDFSAIIRVWSEPLTFFDGSPLEVKAEYGKRVCMEISYPAEKPYRAREKTYCYLDLFNQKR